MRHAPLPESASRRASGKNAIVWIAAAAAAAFASAAIAASLPTVSTPVGAGNTVVPRCDLNGFTYSFTTSGADVTSVVVGDIADPACENGVLQITLTDAGGASLGSAGPQTVPTDGNVLPNSLALSPSPQPSATQVSAIHVSVRGP